MIGFLVAILGSSMGYLEAWAMNTARDLGPRLFAYFAGWGSSALPSPDNCWWIPVAAPLLGGVIGGGAYQLLIHPFLPARVRALQLRPMARTMRKDSASDRLPGRLCAKPKQRLGAGARLVRSLVALIPRLAKPPAGSLYTAIEIPAESRPLIRRGHHGPTCGWLRH
jgi:Major intrinsic protein